MRQTKASAHGRIRFGRTGQTLPARAVDVRHCDPLRLPTRRHTAFTQAGQPGSPVCLPTGPGRRTHAIFGAPKPGWWRHV